jgi:fucose permease
MWVIIPIFFMMGICGGAMDVSINGQAVFVERMHSKPIMSSFHAVFSGAMGLGANIGALFAKNETPLFYHFLLIGVFCFIISIWAYLNLVKDKDNSPVLETVNEEEQPKFRLPTAAILPLGIIAFCGMTGEGSMADWSANYLNKVIGVDAGFAALGVAAFAWAMFLGRLVGDYLVRVFGKRNLLIYSCLIAVVGLSVALSVLNVWVALSGFFLVGLALSNVVPIIYSTAGNTEGVTPSVGIAMATTVGYAGFFIGPPVIGYLADIFSLRIGLLFTLLLFIVMFILVNRFIKK